MTVDEARGASIKDILSDEPGPWDTEAERFVHDPDVEYDGPEAELDRPEPVMRDEAAWRIVDGTGRVVYQQPAPRPPVEPLYLRLSRRLWILDPHDDFVTRNPLALPVSPYAGVAEVVEVRDAPVLQEGTDEPK